MFNKTFFYILLLISNNLIYLSKGCSPVIIMPEEYDFSSIIEKGIGTSGVKCINGKIIAAYKYSYLINHNFYNDIESQIYDNFDQLNQLEEKKIKPDLLYQLYNFILRNKDEFESILNENFDNSNLANYCKDIFKKEKEKYKIIKNDKESGSSVLIQSSIYSAIGAFSGFGLKKFIITSLSNPELALVILGGTLLTSIVSNIWNYINYNRPVSKLKKALYKLNKILEDINLYIYEAKWVDNNCFLTAMSSDENCSGYQVEFYYSKYVVYKNYHGEDITESVMDDMINMTCTYRSNNNMCDYDTCLTNLKNFSECPDKRRKGEIPKCPKFTNNCLLKS